MLSQESSDNESLKLFSQETYQQLCAQLGAEECRPVIDDHGIFMQEVDRLPDNQGHVDQPQSGVLLPTLTEFDGMYGFNIEVGKQPRLSKSTGWCYSPDLNRLYVQLHKPCQLAFILTACGSVATDAHETAAHLGAPGGQPLFIRATPVFTNYLQVPVERCPNHIIADAALVHCRHFVWADHPSAAYFSDTSQRHTTLVPFQFENDVWRKKDSLSEPSGSCRSVWYGYSFKCLNTCTGSLNRRTVSIIFALESSDGTVLGRRVIEVKVCTCPGRDMVRDRKSSEDTPFSVRHPYGRAINYPSLMNEPSKRHRWQQSGSESASTVQARGSHNSSKKLLVRTKVPARQAPLNFSTIATSVEPNQVSCRPLVISPDRTAKNDSSKLVQQSLANDVTYCVQVRKKKNYEILKAVSSLMSAGVSSEALVAACMKRDLNAVSTDSVHSDSDSIQYSSGLKSLPCSSQLSGCSTGFGNTQDNSGGIIEHISKVVDHSARPSIQEWLDSLGLAPYTDDFARAGYRTMTDLQDGRRFSVKDLRKLQIGAAHTAVIWKSLKQWRLQV